MQESDERERAENAGNKQYMSVFGAQRPAQSNNLLQNFVPEIEEYRGVIQQKRYSQAKQVDVGERDRETTEGDQKALMNDIVTRFLT